MRRAFIVGLSLLWFCPSIALSMELPELLRQISKDPVKQAHFTETRTAFYLNKPLISKGNLHFTAPDKMQKHYTDPDDLLQSINGDNLVLKAAKKTEQSLSLRAQPELALGINAIRWLLSGNLDKLKQHFELQYQQPTNDQNNDWKLILIPRELAMQDYIAAVHVRGKLEHILQIRLLSPNGDSITTDLYEHR